MKQRLAIINLVTQLFTSVAVIAGLILVVLELQLTRQAFYDQYALTNISDYSADLSATYGERAADVLAKACFEPSILSNAELIILRHHFRNQVNRIFNVYWQSNFVGDDNWREPAQGFLEEVLQYPQGEQFIMTSNMMKDPVINDLVTGILTSRDNKDCKATLDELRLQDEFSNDAQRFHELDD